MTVTKTNMRQFDDYIQGMIEHYQQERPSTNWTMDRDGNVWAMSRVYDAGIPRKSLA